MENAATTPLPQANAAVARELPVPANAMAALGYLTGLSTIASLVMAEYRDNKEVRFHAWQAILFITTWIVSSAVLSMLLVAITVTLGLATSWMGVAMIPLLYLLPLGIAKIYQLTMLGTWIYLMVASGMGKSARLPLLGKMAANLASPSQSA